jgi:hypothetical protein
MAKTIIVVLDHKAIDDVVSSPEGLVGKEIHKRAKKVRDAAKKQVGKDTYRLMRSIRIYDRHRLVMGQTLKIGSSVPYAYIHHEGSRRHTVTPKNHEFLKFSSTTGGSKGWNVIGGKTLARSVTIPRIRPNRYLSDNVKWFYI